MTKVISVFNNKGGVGKTSILWNLGISLADEGKSVLLIDFDPQCNLSIATLGAGDFVHLLTEGVHGKTIKAFALPYIQQNTSGQIYVSKLKEPSKNGVIEIIPGDFWLNTFSDVLNVGTDVISGSGLYRFLLPELLTQEAIKAQKVNYDYVLIDLPPSFNTLVRSALYCSDYFLVPCTPDLFSSYCISLIGEMLPRFIEDWNQGKDRYLRDNPSDTLINTKGQPKFGGWIFNGFDTRKKNSTRREVGADAVLLEEIKKSVKDILLPSLNKISQYQSVPSFVTPEPVVKIEDLNVMAPDSIFQNVPIQYLHQKKPTQQLRNRGGWAENQVNLMQSMAGEYKKLAEYIITNFK